MCQHGNGPAPPPPGQTPSATWLLHASCHFAPWALTTAYPPGPGRQVMQTPDTTARAAAAQDPAGRGCSQRESSDTHWRRKEGLPKAVTEARTSRPPRCSEDSCGPQPLGAGAGDPDGRPKGSPEAGHLPLCVEGRETRGRGCLPSPHLVRSSMGFTQGGCTREALMVAKWVPCRLAGPEELHGGGGGGSRYRCGDAARYRSSWTR